MSEAGTERKPIAEMTILLIGSILTAVAIHLESDVLLIPSIFTCIFAGIAALLCAPLSRQAIAFKATVTVVGMAGVVFGLTWWMGHKNDPEIFSPMFVGYIGGGLVLAGICNLAADIRQRQAVRHQGP